MKKNYKILFKNSNKCDSIEIFSFAIHPFDLIVKKKKKKNIIWTNQSRANITYIKSLTLKKKKIVLEVR